MKQKEYSKKRAGEKAVEFIESGMSIGLGSGSTVYWMMKKLGEYVQQGLQVEGVPTSVRTERWANEFGIPLTDFSKIQSLDLAIDGADEIDNNFNLIKGGGGSLVKEKIIDQFSDQLIIIADESKMVSKLGIFPLPVEVVPFGWEVTARNIAQLGYTPQLRNEGNKVFVSDNGNYILDCRFGRIENPKMLHEKLKPLTGVVETGLFVEITDKVIIGKGEEIKILSRKG